MRHDWKFLTVLMTGACVAGSLSLVAQQRGTAAAPSAAMIARGKYLVTIQDCNGCHTPFNEKGEPDMSKMLSGHPANVKVAAPRPKSGDWLVSINSTNTAWSGPWGVSFTSNLTQDRATGIGSNVHRGDPPGQEERRRSAAAESDAVADVRDVVRRRLESDICVLEDGPGDFQPRAQSTAAGAMSARDEHARV